MTTKSELNARVKITAGPAAGQFGRIAHSDASTWTADVALDDGRMAKGIPMKFLDVIAEEHVTDRAKLLDRIRKLHAQAESAAAIGNEAEAMTFVAAVQKMLAKYRLSLDDLAMEQLDRDEPVQSEWYKGRGGRHELWYGSLAAVVAKAHFCRVLFSSRNDDLFLVGRATDRKIAQFVIVTLARTADELSDKAARKFRKELRRQQGATDHNNRNYRAEWLTGFVERIAERYRQEAEEMERVQKASGGTSLVLVTSQSLAKADTFIRANIRVGALRTGAGRQAGASASATGKAHGRAAANGVSIRGTGLGASSETSRKQIGGN